MTRTTTPKLVNDPGARLTAASFVVNGLLYGSLLSRYAEIADGVDATEAAFGVALTAGAIGGLAGSALAPALVRLLDEATAVTVAGCAYAIAAVCVAWSPGPAVLAVALLVSGLVDGGHDVSMNALAVRVQQRRGRSVMGRAHAAWSLSLAAGTGLGVGAASLGVPVTTHVGTIAVASGGLQLLAGWTARAGRATEPDSPVRPAPTTRLAGATRRGARRVLLPLIVAAVAASYVEGPGQDWTALLLSRGLEAGPGAAAAGPLAFSLGLLTSRLALDPLTRRISSPMIAALAAGVIVLSMLAGLAAGLLDGPPWVALTAIAAAGLGAGPAYPLLFSTAETLAREGNFTPSTTAAVISTCSRVGAVTAPVTVGALTGTTSLFAVFAVMATGGLLLLASLPRALPADPR